MEKLKLDLACSKDDARPAMNYIKVTKEKMIATDGYIMAVIDTDEVFPKEFILDIPNEGMLIHRDDWKKMIQYDVPSWKTEGKVIKMTHSKKRSMLIEVEFEKDIETYPNWGRIIPQGDSIPISEIGIDLNLANKLQQALNLKSCALNFYGCKKPIKILPAREDKKRMGIIMPVILKNIQK